MEKNKNFAKFRDRHVTCFNCGAFTIKLMPDYESTALWCASCGMMIQEEDTLLPEEILKKIREWNNEWMKADVAGYNPSLPERGFNKKGVDIALEIIQYHPVVLFISEEKN